MGTLSTLLGQYLEPARVVPRDRATLGRIARSMRSAHRQGDTAAMPVAVGFEVSDACNLACTVCSREVDWDRRDLQFMPLARFQALYDEIRPPYVNLTGYGETTLHKQLPAMIEHATRGGSRVQIITNGTLLTPDRSSDLLDAGLARLKVSIDGVDPAVYAEHRQGGDLEKVLQNVEKLMAMRDARRLPGPLVELQMVLFRENLDEAEKLIELCGTRFVGVNPNFLVMFTYGEQAGFVERTVPFGDEGALRTLRAARVRAAARGFRRGVSSLDQAITQLTTDLSAAPCFIPWYSAMISTDGAVYPCCYHSVRGVSVGNAYEAGFEPVWNGPRMAEFRRALRTRRCDDKVCATCKYEDAGMAAIFRFI